jgi:hypothetical protein
MVAQIAVADNLASTVAVKVGVSNTVKLFVEFQINLK